MKDFSFKCHVWNIENNENISKLYDQKLTLYDMPTFTYDLSFYKNRSLPWNDIIYAWEKWKPSLKEIYHKNALGNKTFGDILFTST